MTITTSTRTAEALPVDLSGVGRTFGTGEDARVVLRDVDLEIAPGEIIVLLGPSGCGKSTLLRQVAGLDAPTAGSVSVGGSTVRGIENRAAVAFQEPRLLPWRSVTRNVEVGLPRGTAKEPGRSRVDELLRLVQLSDASNLRPREISGGMAQRASLARALARNPGVLLLDEPFGALDALTRLTMQDLLLDVHRAEPTTILLVTHDVDEALYLADRVVLLGTEPGYTAGSGATIRSIITVPGRRPRDRGDASLAHLRAQLLEGLGVSTHHPAHTL